MYRGHALYDSLEGMRHDREDKNERNRTDKRAFITKLRYTNNNKLLSCGKWEYDDGVLYAVQGAKAIDDPSTPPLPPSLFIVKDFNDGFGVRSYEYTAYSTLGGATNHVRTHQPPLVRAGIRSATHRLDFVSVYVAEFRKTTMDCDDDAGGEEGGGAPQGGGYRIIEKSLNTVE